MSKDAIAGPCPRPPYTSRQLLRLAVVGVLSFSFLNALYCTLSYEFGGAPKSYLDGPEDRFADLIKLSLSFRSVTEGADKTPQFKNWPPIYQHYYEEPDYGGPESLAAGELTHFHHPPLNMLLLLLCGSFIVRSWNPSLALYLFFCIYLFEVGCVLWIGIPRAKRTRDLTLSVLFLCMLSYPALLIFSRANYVNAGLTTLPVVVFLIATFTRERAHLLSLLALAVAVNTHPNAIIFLAALPLAFGIQRSIKPLLQFTAMFSSILIVSYLAAHRLYADYTLETFRQGLAIYRKFYIEKGIGVAGGSSLYGLVFILHHGFGSGPDPRFEIRMLYVLAALLTAIACFAYFVAVARHRDTSAENESGSASESQSWPRPLAPFFLVSLYCILSPIFADYHLLVFLAPLVLACLDAPQQTGTHSRLVVLIAFVSAFMLSPKHYGFFQILLNPLVLCIVLVWVSLVTILDSRRSVHAATTLAAADWR